MNFQPSFRPRKIYFITVSCRRELTSFKVKFAVHRITLNFIGLDYAKLKSTGGQFNILSVLTVKLCKEYCVMWRIIFLWA